MKKYLFILICMLTLINLVNAGYYTKYVATTIQNDLNDPQYTNDTNLTSAGYSGVAGLYVVTKNYSLGNTNYSSNSNVNLTILINGIGLTNKPDNISILCYNLGGMLGVNGWVDFGDFTYNNTSNTTYTTLNVRRNEYDAGGFTGNKCLNNNQVVFNLTRLVGGGATNGVYYYEDWLWFDKYLNLSEITYSQQSSSGSLENFKLNLSYDSNYYSSISVYLNYNDTNYTTTIIGTGDNKLFNANINVPTITTQTNFTFYFIISLTNSSGYTTLFNSTFNNQSVYTFGIDNCTTFKTPILNLSMIDEETLVPINGTIEILTNIYSVGSSVPILTYNNTLNYDTTKDTKICSTNLTSNYTLDYTIKYQGNSSYFIKYKANQYTLFNNNTIPIQVKLYNLLLTSGYSFSITLTGNVPSNSDLLVEAQRQYLDLNSFIPVESAVSDSNDNVVLHLTPQTEVYNFIVSYYGTVVGTFNLYKVQCQNTITGQCTFVLNMNQATNTNIDYKTYQNISSTYNLDRTNNILYYNFNSIDGTSKTIVQTVLKNDGYGNTTICTNTVTGSSGTLTCNIPTLYQNSTFYSEVTANGVYLGSSFFSLGTRLDFQGADIFIELLLYSTLVMLFLAHPILIVIGAILGVTLSILLLWTTGGTFVALISTLIYFIGASIIIIWQIGRKL